MGGALDAGVGVGEGVAAMPGDFAGGDDAFAEEANFVVLPGEFGKEGGEGSGGFGLGKQGAKSVDGTVTGEQVLRGGRRFEVREVSRRRGGHKKAIAGIKNKKRGPRERSGVACNYRRHKKHKFV